jgi:hypothetical protein
MRTCYLTPAHTSVSPKNIKAAEKREVQFRLTGLNLPNFAGKQRLCRSYIHHP